MNRKKWKKTYKVINNNRMLQMSRVVTELLRHIAEEREQIWHKGRDKRT